MRQPKVAHRYAKALFDISVETNQLEIVKSDLDKIAGLKNSELNLFLSSPVIKPENKTAVFESVFSKHVSKLTVSFFKLVFSKGRSIAMAEIMEAYQEMYRKSMGIQVVEMTTAVPISDDLKVSILKALSGFDMLKDKKIELKQLVDESIIGGMLLQIEDTLIDASIKRDLQTIKRQFVKNMYVKELR
jgi:F-type H+-transporting ATPase subunit delta